MAPMLLEFIAALLVYSKFKIDDDTLIKFIHQSLLLCMSTVPDRKIVPDEDLKKMFVDLLLSTNLQSFYAKMQTLCIIMCMTSCPKLAYSMMIVVRGIAVHKKKMAASSVLTVIAYYMYAIRAMKQIPALPKLTYPETSKTEEKRDNVNRALARGIEFTERLFHTAAETKKRKLDGEPVVPAEKKMKKLQQHTPQVLKPVPTRPGAGYGHTLASMGIHP